MNQLNLLLANGADDQASRSLDKFLARSDLDPDVLLKVGIAFAHRGLYHEASLVFLRCTKDYPAVSEGHYNLALALLAGNHPAQALSAIEGAPYSPQIQDTAALHLRGKIEDSLGRTQQAERDLAEAFERKPTQEDYGLDLGLHYLRAGDFRRAEQTFEQSLKFNSNSPYLLLSLALAEFLSGKSAQSAETCRHLLRLQPQFSTARLLLAFTLYFQGDLKEAHKVAVIGLALNDPDPYLSYLGATILVKEHSLEFDRIYKNLAAAERGIPQCGLCFVASGKAHEEQGDWPAAVSDFAMAVRVTPDLADAWYRLALALKHEGKKVEAIHAEEQFKHLSARKANQERQMLQNAFLRSFGERASKSARPK